jgi:hypothetical protein
MNDQKDKETKQMTINYYAALGVGLLTTLAIAFFVTITILFIIFILQDNSSASPLIGFALSLLVAMLFFGLTAILASKHGWKTVVFTYIVQAFLTLIVAATLLLIFTPRDNSRYENSYRPTHDSNCINC